MFMGRIAISIIIPVNNEEKHLPNLLESIDKYLKLNIDCQKIVVLNGCIDNSLDISVKYKCDIVQIKSRVFPSVARNKGVEHACHDIMAFIDADVVLTEQWSKRILSLIPFLENNPYTITGDKYHISDNPSYLERYWFGSYDHTSCKYINGGNIVTTKVLFNLLNGFDEKIETSEDEDFCRRARKSGANLKHDKELRAIHNGYPRNIKSFIKRERWHGIGDFQKLDNLINSPVALITLLFVSIHGILIAAIPFLLLHGEYTILIFFCLVFIISICLICSFIKFRYAGLRKILVCCVIFYFYFMGRSLALFDFLKDRFKKR